MAQGAGILIADVYAGYIHYKVRAIMQDGSSVESDVETIRIVSRK